MSAPRIILAFLSSCCQKLLELVEILNVLTKTNLHSFLRHAVYVRVYRISIKVAKTLFMDCGRLPVSSASDVATNCLHSCRDFLQANLLSACCFPTLQDLYSCVIINLVRFLLRLAFSCVYSNKKH